MSMNRTSFDPFYQGWELFNRFMCCGFGGRRFYTRKERIEQLEKMKQQLQQELSGIQELIEDLKRKDVG